MFERAEPVRSAVACPARRCHRQGRQARETLETPPDHEEGRSGAHTKPTPAASLRPPPAPPPLPAARSAPLRSRGIFTVPVIPGGHDVAGSEAGLLPPQSGSAPHPGSLGAAPPGYLPPCGWRLPRRWPGKSCRRLPPRQKGFRSWS